MRELIGLLVTEVGEIEPEFLHFPDRLDITHQLASFQTADLVQLVPEEVLAILLVTFFHVLEDGSLVDAENIFGVVALKF